VIVMRGARKAPTVGASELKEETMKLITRFELASKSIGELHALHREALKAFAAAARGTQERRDALVSVANLESEIRSRPEP
jgi:hypothetical protein